MRTREWLISIAAHGLLFTSLAFAGVFDLNAALPSAPEQPIDVLVYDAAVAMRKGGAPAPSVDEIPAETVPTPTPDTYSDKPTPAANAVAVTGNITAPGGLGDGTGNNANGDVSGSGNSLRPKTPPQLVRRSAPKYPESLRRDEIEGVVRLRLLVGTDGTVEDVEVVSSSGHDAMDSAAVNAACRYKFKPARNAGGQAVRCHVTTSVRFALK